LIGLTRKFNSYAHIFVGDYPSMYAYAISHDTILPSSTGGDVTKDSVYERQGFGGQIGFGERPALLVVDFTAGFVDPASFGGGNIAQAMKHTLPLLDLARREKIPVVHTKIVYAEDGSDAGIHCLKSRHLKTLTASNPLSDFAPDVMPQKGEIVLTKRLPSAFFETGLAGLLAARGVDTVVIAGCTTSGCVRASTLDAMCFGFRPMVVRDCVGDRATGPHDASLFDLGQKYADVIDSDTAMKSIESVVARRRENVAS
jgi:maleamate amidohydrolase